jgi:hypothetical protein
MILIVPWEYTILRNRILPNKEQVNTNPLFASPIQWPNP